ncbi:DUF6069 family protein [Streptomyces sp. NPDC006186]|uniref:DUF6069 family protein n=2 Tax=Streptomyces TaxID=1883 RepID=A0ABV5V7H7_9ACTN
METPDGPRAGGRASYDAVRTGTGPQPSPPAPPPPPSSSVAPPAPPNRGAPARSRLNAGRLWAGGVMTAGVAGLTAMVAVVLARGVFGVSVFGPAGEGVQQDTSATVPAVTAAGAALGATGALHVLALLSRRPCRVFSWLVTSATVALVLLPFTTDAATGEKVGAAAVRLAVGVTVGAMLSAVGRGALRRGGR